ncbi:flavoprotein [Legionella fairfieldensis]|uniref:flavoprotein n=1 Tax=Legionella fairfieldensis TaxID=45064 RepID=UPI00048A9A5E|nr:flavoprotein [Legionella fairfieldensis]
MKKNILLGVSSGIGAKDTIHLIQLLTTLFNVKVMVSSRAENFFDLNELKSLVPVFDDHSEWYTWKKRGDEVLHISLRNWADVFLIAPLSANTLAKMTQGIADNLILTVARAWVLNKKSLIVAPSMNRFMWEHPLTRRQLTELHSWGIREIPPRCKMLSGGDFGVGALEKPEIILAYIEDLLKNG